MAIQENGRPSRKGGFSLVEVLVASALTAFVFVAVFSSLVFCRKAVADIRIRAAAECLAADKMDEIFNKPLLWFADLPSSGLVHSWDPIPDSLQQAYFGFAAYDASASDASASFAAPGEVRLFYSVIPGGTPVDHWAITVDVAWSMNSGSDTESGRLSSPLHLSRYNIGRATFREKSP
jgi:hypothetical protein